MYVIQYLINNGFKILICFEGEVDRFIDVISEINSDNIILHFESLKAAEYQQYFEGKKTYLSGFYPIYYVKYSSVNECLDYARILLNEVRGNSRYIFSTNKLLYTPEDVNYKNLLEVYHYVNQFIP